MPCVQCFLHANSISGNTIKKNCCTNWTNTLSLSQYEKRRRLLAYRSLTDGTFDVGVMIREGAISRNSNGIYIMQNRSDQVARSCSNAVTRGFYVPEYGGFAATAFLCRPVAETSTVAWKYPTSNSTKLERTFAKLWVTHRPPRAVKWASSLPSRSVRPFVLPPRFCDRGFHFEIRHSRESCYYSKLFLMKICVISN